MRLGNYEIEEQLFRSGPSTFFRARNAILGNPVIVRRLDVDPARATEVRETFFLEMRHAASLMHPKIQRALDVMELDGYLWSVHEFRTATQTDQRVRENGPFTVPEAARMGSEVSDALSHLHARGFVHGKISPRWVVADEQGVQVINLVKSAELAAGHWPLRPVVLGLSPFSAPEEFAGARPTAESDVHAFAGTFLYWLTGAYPRGGATEEEALERARQGAPAVDPRASRSDVPDALADALAAALEPDPSRRHGSAASLGTLLAEIHRRLAAEVPSGFESGVRLKPAGCEESLEILGRHGSGAFGVVFRAKSSAGRSLYAVKALKPEHRNDTEARERFLREARAIQDIEHPNVVKIRGVGEENGTPYCVMEFIPGPDLGTILLREGMLPPARAARLGAGIARGLEAIHQEGIVHRDLKPHNILVAPGDRPVIADFGVARSLAAPRLTMTGHLVGTPAYMAPEQFDDHPTTVAVDLYALGAILYELLTGNPPFPGKDAMTTIRAIRDTPAPRLPPEMPDAFAVIVERLLRKEPSQRYARAGVLASDLEALSGRLGSERAPDLSPRA
jgi:serine/threonine protein kinase